MVKEREARSQSGGKEEEEEKDENNHAASPPEKLWDTCKAFIECTRNTETIHRSTHSTRSPPPPRLCSHLVPSPIPPLRMSKSFSELAQTFIRQRAGQAFKQGGPRPGGNGGPSIGALFGGAGGVVLLAVGGLAINASLFNGEPFRVLIGRVARSKPPPRGCRNDEETLTIAPFLRRATLQSTEVTVRSSTPVCMVSPRRSLQRELTLPFVPSPPPYFPFVLISLRADPLARDSHHLRRPL